VTSCAPLLHDKLLPIIPQRPLTGPELLGDPVCVVGEAEKKSSSPAQIPRREEGDEFFANRRME